LHQSVLSFFQLTYSNLHNWGVATANAFDSNPYIGSILLSDNPITDKVRQKAILGSLYASVPHFMFLFIMTEIMLKEHHQEQNPQQQPPLAQFTAAEVDANFNEETGTEEDEEEGPLPGQ